MFEEALEVIRSKSSGESNTRLFDVTINFHPDRFTADGRPLLLSLLDDGLLKSQFETGTSNGGLSAFTGGNRWYSEKHVFNGVYDNCEPHQRPKYGALNFKHLAFGASPRFGSSYFRLKPHISKRTTFCYPDSVFKPNYFATYERIDPLLELIDADDCDELDAYIEAHIHGDVLLSDDVEEIVLDPSYKGTDIEDFAKQLPCDVQWHLGFELNTGVMQQYPHYRGQEIVDLGKEIALDDRINPHILGVAIHELMYAEQDIKKVWHYLARFGYRSG